MPSLNPTPVLADCQWPPPPVATMGLPNPWAQGLNLWQHGTTPGELPLRLNHRHVKPKAQGSLRHYGSNGLVVHKSVSCWFLEVPCLEISRSHSKKWMQNTVDVSILRLHAVCLIVETPNGKSGCIQLTWSKGSKKPKPQPTPISGIFWWSLIHSCRQELDFRIDVEHVSWKLSLWINRVRVSPSNVQVDFTTPYLLVIPSTDYGCLRPFNTPFFVSNIDLSATAKHLQSATVIEVSRKVNT